MFSNPLFLYCDIFFWAIIGLGTLALLIAIQRFFVLQNYRVDVSVFLNGIQNNLDREGTERNNVNEAIVLCEEHPGPVSDIVAEAIRHRDLPRADLARILHSEGLDAISRMERRLSFIALVAQIAPVLGLLGTVFTLVHIVQTGIQTAPLFQTRDLLVAIKPALYNSAAGLGVALPAYAAYNLLVLKIDRLVIDMERAANKIIPYLDARHPRSDSRQQTLGL